MLENIRLAHHELRLEPGQPGTAVAEAAPCVMVLGLIPEGADPEIRAACQHLRWDITRGRVELDRLERAAVGEVLAKRTLIRTGVEWQLADYFFMRPPNRQGCQSAEFVSRLMAELGEPAQAQLADVRSDEAIVAGRATR